ncbi:hypothetical protein [Pseudomonas sp. NPDC007930]|uniref:hypothetical protein n=1 Tax=Pseudomonas sp. NPDC007930 TaxID=3364417 RepID=UPI0036E9CA75
MTHNTAPRLSAHATQLNAHLRLSVVMAEPSETTVDPQAYADTSDPGDYRLKRSAWVNGLPIQVQPPVNWDDGGTLVIQRSREGGDWETVHEDKNYGLGDPALPYEWTVPASELVPDGSYRFQAVVDTWGTPVTGKALTVVADKLAPYAGNNDKNPLPPLPAEAVVTLEYLGANNDELKVAVPSYADWASKDQVYLFLESEMPEQPGTVPLHQAATVAGDTEVAISRAALEAKGEGEYYLTYALRDVSGNLSALALPARVSLVLSALPPASLPAPELVSGRAYIDLEDVRNGVDLRVKAYANQQRDDGLPVQWGQQPVGGFLANPAGADSLVSVASATVIASFGAATAPVDVPVSYRVTRLGWRSSESAGLTVTVDLRSTGPTNPNFPDPVNPNLARLAFESASGATDEIPEADYGKDGKFSFEVFEGAEADDVIDFYWQDQKIATYTVLAADKPQDERAVDLAWADLESILGQQQAIAYYRLYKPEYPVGNFQQSADTPVDTSQLPLLAEPVSFPNAYDPGNGTTRVHCGALQDRNALGTPSIPADENDAVMVVRIPDLSQPPLSIKAGDTLSLTWQSYKGPTSSDPIPENQGGRFELVDHPLTAAEVQGFDVLVPYVPHGKVTYHWDGSCASPPTARLEVGFSVTRADGKVVQGPVASNVQLTLLRADGDCWGQDSCTLR